MPSTTGRARLMIGLALPLLLASTGCGRWMEYTPTRIQGQVQDPDLVYKRLVQRSQTMGYTMHRVDPTRRYFAVKAHLDQRGFFSYKKVSYFHVAVRESGVVDVTAQGYHVRHGSRIHRKLCDELNVYLDSLSLEIGPPGPPLAPLPPAVVGQF
jgi:hypothetical protein